MTVKQVIVMRTDLNMRKGKMCAQASHASMMFLLKQLTVFPNGHLRMMPTAVQREWMDGSFTKICVRTNSEEELRQIISDAQNENLTVHEVIDNGATEFGGVKTLTCAAIGPHEAEFIDKITGHLELL